jgi:hypothetical protein
VIPPFITTSHCSAGAAGIWDVLVLVIVTLLIQ